MLPRLVQTCTDAGLVLNGVRPGSAAGMGLGMFASRQLDAGEEVVVAPAPVWRPVSAATATAAPRVRDHVAFLLSQSNTSSPALLASSVALSLHLLHALHSGEAYSGGVPAAFAAFVPKLGLEVPMLWPDDRLQAQLPAFMLRDVAKRRRVVAGVHQQLTASAAASGGGSPPPLPQLAWAWSTVLSRCLSGTPSERGTPGATTPPAAAATAAAATGAVLDTTSSSPVAAAMFSFVPVMDLVNHRRQSPDGSLQPGDCALTYDATRDRYVATVLQGCDAGQQVFASYGSHMTAESLLRQYGFVGDDDVRACRVVVSVDLLGALQAGAEAPNLPPGFAAARMAAFEAAVQHPDVASAVDSDGSAGAQWRLSVALTPATAAAGSPLSAVVPSPAVLHTLRVLAAPPTVHATASPPATEAEWRRAFHAWATTPPPAAVDACVGRLVAAACRQALAQFPPGSTTASDRDVVLRAESANAASLPTWMVACARLRLAQRAVLADTLQHLQAEHA